MISIFFHMIKIMSIVAGFFGAFSLVRSSSTAFYWYTRFFFGGFVNFRFTTSLISLLAAMSILGFSTWQTKPRGNSVLSRIDFSLILLVGCAGFYICYLILTGQTITPWAIGLLHVSITAYLLTVFCFVEFIARIRDRNLLATLYWLSFFKMYHSQAISYVAAVLLVSQLFMIIYFRNLPIVLISVAVISLLTYFATFLMSLSKVYIIANEDKIRSERFKTELITNVSHDIKTPLTSIINYVDLLKTESLQGQAAEYLQVLDRKTARLKTLIDDLMEASKAGTGNLRVDLQEVNLLEIVGQVAGEFEDKFSGNGLVIVLRQPEEQILCNTDNRHLYRVLENLFSNASKYALGGTRVFVEVTLHDSRPHIIMQNTSACPVDFSDGEATEQFIRGDKSRNTEGSGLGLYIAKSLIELMGGELSINVSGDLFRVDVFL